MGGRTEGGRARRAGLAVVLGRDLLLLAGALGVSKSGVARGQIRNWDEELGLGFRSVLESRVKGIFSGECVEGLGRTYGTWDVLRSAPVLSGYV